MQCRGLALDLRNHIAQTVVKQTKQKKNDIAYSFNQTVSLKTVWHMIISVSYLWLL